MELKEVIEKYGSIPLFFSSYYKYSFSFEGETSDVKIIAEYGGDADEIYRYNVDAGAPEFLDDSFRYITIKDKSTGETIYANY